MVLAAGAAGAAAGCSPMAAADFDFSALASCTTVVEASCDLPYDEDDNGIVDVQDILGALAYFNVGC